MKNFKFKTSKHIMIIGSMQCKLRKIQVKLTFIIAFDAELIQLAKVSGVHETLFLDK